MAQEEASGVAGWWERLRSKASSAVVEQQEGFVRDKVAGVAVTDAQGKLLVAAGQRIDEQILRQARAANKIAALAASVVQAQAQDAHESMQTHYGRTETGREARLLESVEEYQEVHRYVGRMLTLDVTDIRGNVVVAAGKVLDHADAERARDAGLIAALLAVAEQSVPAPSQSTSAPPPLASSTVSSSRLAPRLLTEPDEEPEKQASPNPDEDSSIGTA